jgi:hypothetical protein
MLRERFPRTAVWPWVVATFALVFAVAWFVASRPGDNTGGDASEANPDLVASTSGTAASAVHEYMQLADTLEDRPGADPAFAATTTAEGLRRLAAALATLGVGSPDLAIDLRITAEHVVLNPSSPATSEAVRKALIATAAAIGEQQPNAVAALQQSAEAVTPTAPLDSQQSDVHEFLRRSARALAAMAEDGAQRTPPGPPNAPR